MLGWSRAEAVRASRSKRSSDLGILGEFFGQEFQGDEAAEFEIFGLIDDAHSAAAEFLHNAVVRNVLLGSGLVVVHRLRKDNAIPVDGILAEQRPRIYTDLHGLRSR